MSSYISGSNYAWAFRYLDRDVKFIVEVGSRDGLDAIALGKFFNCPVAAFECDPRQYSITQANILKSGESRISVHDVALSDESGPIEFWQVDTTRYENPGSGSLFKINFDNRTRDDLDAGIAPIQEVIRVPCARFEDLKMDVPDLLVMDVQGAELKVLKGFGDSLLSCKYIICEAEWVPSYIGGVPFKELNKFLKSKGFTLTGSTVGKGTRLSLVTHYWKSMVRTAIRNWTLSPNNLYVGSFDVCYVRQ